MSNNTFQNNLWSNTDQMEEILSNLQTGVLIIDKDTKQILKANPAVCQMTGKDIEEIVGAECYDIVCTENRGQCPACQIYPDKLQTECILTHVNGESTPILKTVTPVQLDGRACFLESIVDISAQKKVENRLRKETERVEKLAQKAEAAYQAKSEFLANISHELRTPLNGVIGMAGLLKDSPLSEEQKCYADTMYVCADSLLKLVNGVLDYSYLEAGQIELTRRSFNLRNLVGSVVELIKGPIRKKNLSLSVNIEDVNFSTLLGDPSRLQQVLMVFADNAIKFTEQGTIELSLSLRDDDSANSRIRFSVRDTGIGVPENMDDRIFERFIQADGSLTRKHGGTGLGLATAKQIIHLMAGEIGLKRIESGGSEFWFEVTLPKITPVPKQSPRRKKILVVDDSATNRLVMENIIKKIGYDCETAEGGEEAIEMLAASSFDLVFMDIQMPNMSGIVTCKAIRAGLSGKESENVPIIALSASALDDDLGWKEAGMNHRLTKFEAPEKIADFLSNWFNNAPPTVAPTSPGSTVPSQTPQPLVLDKQRLRSRLMGDDAILDVILHGFIGDMPNQIHQLSQFIKTGDVEGAKIRAHGIKGASATVCADRMSSHAAKMEHYAELGEIENLENEMGLLQTIFDEFKQVALRAEFETKSK